MAKHGKKYLNTLKAAPKKPVSIEEAVKFVKAHPAAKFDETLDVSMRLGADTKKMSGSSVHGIFQGRILEWVAISFSLNMVN